MNDVVVSDVRGGTVACSSGSRYVRHYGTKSNVKTPAAAQVMRNVPATVE